MKYSDGRARLPKGTEVVEWTARLPEETYLFLVELARRRGQELPVALNNLIEDYRATFHKEQ